MPFFGGGLLLSLLVTVLLCVHVVRTNQSMFWIFVLVFLGPIGWLIYLGAVILPEMLGGTRAKRMGMAARDALDPTREYRTAKAAVADTPTVHNRMRLAAAAAGLGKHAEAEQLYAEAAQGIHADDPALLLGRANALIELGRTDEALGRFSEADAAYQFAAGRLTGLEALARYAAFLARVGRKPEAADHLAEIDRRIERANPQFRREGRAWRDLAAQALARA